MEINTTRSKMSLKTETELEHQGAKINCRSTLDKPLKIAKPIKYLPLPGDAI
jgi:hypothetical protein